MYLRSLLHVVLAAAFLAIGPGPSVRADDGQPRQLTEVGKLIEQLGADSYATRVRAREKLQRMGLEAFDELHLAQFHPDIEIEMAARYLVSSLLVSWSKETDPPEVREALHEYGAQEESERLNRIEMLAEYPSRKGLPALVRLARFETSLRLSRQAALAAMRQRMDTDPAVRRRNAEQIVDALGSNERQAAEWLRVYAEDLSRGTYSVDRWRQLITAQRDEIDSAATQQSSRPSVLELVRICATRAAEADLVDEAIRLARENVDLIPPTTRDLVDACSWAIDNGLHPFVLDLRDRYGQMFDRQPILLYGAAEAKTVAGDVDEANRLAEQAAMIRPLPTSEDEQAKMQPKEIEEAAQAHRELGKKLAERGLFRWAEREFRQIIEAMELDSNPSAIARADLAEMLGELERHDDVVEVLKPLVERLENDDKLKNQLDAIYYRYNRIRSDVEYHSALSKIAAGQPDEARPMLQRAFRLFPENIDILISMYRLDGDAAWRESVRATLQAAIHQAEAEVQNARNQARQWGRAGNEALASEYNQYAWLVSNTEGDYQQALDYSLKSLELATDYAKLDTCARCYFAVGDFDNAIVMQKRALKYMPHSPPLVRQLAEFEAAREKQQQGQ